MTAYPEETDMSSTDTPRDTQMADMDAPRRIDITFWPETGEVAIHTHRTHDGSDTPAPLTINENQAPELIIAIEEILDTVDRAPDEGWPAWATEHLGGQSAVGDPIDLDDPQDTGEPT